ncbi:MAG: DUF3078 domain-containing protein [Myxococcota bacterium]
MRKIILLAALVAVSLSAQVTQLDLKSSATPALKPWQFSGTLGATFSWTATQNFVGTSSRNTAVYPSLQGNMELKYKDGDHEWRNNLALSLGYSYYPLPYAWLKTSDNLKISSIYLYHQLPWFGYFAMLNMKTSMLPGKDIESGENNYLITDVLTGQKTTVNNVTSLDLSSAFAPMFLEQWLGLFAQFVDKPEVFFEYRLGAAFRENLGEGQRAISCNGACDPNYIDVQQLANVYEIGPGSGILFKTNFFDKKLSYRVDFDVVYALMQTPQIKPPGSWSRFSFDLSSTLGCNLLSWLSLNWTLRALQNPAVIDQVQFLSNLSLAANFTL